MPTPRGDLLVITNDTCDGDSIVLPKKTRFNDREDYKAYVGLYDYDEPLPGEVRIISPTVVEKNGNGWVVRQRGRLEAVAPDQEKSRELSLNAEFASDYAKGASVKTVVSYDGAESVLTAVDSNQYGALVVAENSGGDPFVLPRVTRFSGERGFLQYFNSYYKDFYDCARPSAGNLFVVAPATVRKTNNGWRLLKRGILEVRQSQENTDHLASENMAAIPVDTDELPSSNRTSRIKVILLGTLLFCVVLWLSVLWKSSPEPGRKSLTEPKSMSRVSGGTFSMGDNQGGENERPQHNVTVNTFDMDTHEVTRKEYQDFISATSHRRPQVWTNNEYPLNTGRWPVTGVDWYDAASYCNWLHKRLPTEAEWELAARGFDGRRYPWGNGWKLGAANAHGATHGLTDVDRFTEASPFGLIGMSGNAWEWTVDKLEAYPGGQIPLDELGDGKVELRVIRGGSWESKYTSATTTYRWGWPASGGDYSNTGFRCVKDVGTN